MTSDYGKEGLLVLRESTPRVGGGESHKIILDAGRAQGWAECLDYIDQIIASEVKKEEQLDNP